MLLILYSKFEIFSLTSMKINAHLLGVMLLVGKKCFVAEMGWASVGPTNASATSSDHMLVSIYWRRSEAHKDQKLDNVFMELSGQSCCCLD